jgi:MoxR-like ATPase
MSAANEKGFDLPPVAAMSALRSTLNHQVLGQPRLVERLLIALLADGHLLIEGAPGLAKTRSVKALAAAVEADFHRIQFTPDLLPADLIGTEVFRPQDGSFHFERGPLFHHVLLADEVNRAPAKVQSALLEAMGERQITVGRSTYALPKLFLVVATENPIEHEGTYPLPEAQLDRFLMQVLVDYPDQATEQEILDLARAEALGELDRVGANPPVLSQAQIFAARREVLALHLAPPLKTYIVELVAATRHPERYGSDLAGRVRYGASPRGSIALERCARARAWLAGRDYVSPDDIQALAPNVLRHRVLLSYEAEAEGVTPDGLVGELLARVPVP